MIPVVFIHQGDQDYLRTALNQASHWNDEVVLLGIGNEHLWSPWYPWVSERFKDFQAVYQHMNTNPEPFELACFYRWFALRDWMEQQGIDRAWYCDSDVMLYCDVTEWAESVGNPDVSCQIPKHQPEYRWSASAHVSLWTLDALDAFCQYFPAAYTDEARPNLLEAKWQWHQEQGKPGGVCDMTLLYLWLSDIYLLGHFQPMTSVVNNAQVINGATFDHNINVAENYEPNEYQMQDGIKRLSFLEDWNDSRPKGVKADGSETVFFNSLHFQGPIVKPLMRDYAL